ncbi:protein SICKLE-like [Typha latifolia]|uniref:protein SICKLE-like n=1 Tax=Typha latifolia TaxID=4733 RepID=UPI003C306167
MEDSAKRKERLLAIRMEAASAAASSRNPSPSTPELPDPLIQPPSAAEISPRAPRFDYYTNPTAAFSGSKRKSGYHNNPPSPIPPPPSRPSPGPRDYQTSYINPPVQRFQTTHFQAHSIYETPSHTPQSNLWRSPAKFQTPLTGYGGSNLTHTPQNNPWRSPAQIEISMSGFRGLTPPCPNSSNISSGFVGHNSHPNSSAGGFMNPSFRGRGSPTSNRGIAGSPHSNSGRGTVWQYGGSPHPNSGRGNNYGGSPSSRGRGGRGRGSYDGSSGRQEPKSYYIKSMVKDPWRKLKPIVGDILKPRDSSKSCVPESLTAQESKHKQKSVQSGSGLSLAEYLDMTFKDTVDETTSVCDP